MISSPSLKTLVFIISLLLTIATITSFTTFTPITKTPFVQTPNSPSSKHKASSPIPTYKTVSKSVHFSTVDSSSPPTSVKKLDFIAQLSSKSGLSKVDSEAALAAVIDTITDCISQGKKISMLGFGTFKLSNRSERMGRNPKTGESLVIKASKSPTFSASRSFKEKCNVPRED